MNDLAEKALDGLVAARREARDHPLLCFGVLGFVLASVVLVLGSQVGAAEPTRPLTTWLLLQSAGHARRGALRPALFVVAVVALVLVWLALAGYVRRHPQRPERVWRVAAAWAVPFVVGPPLLDTSVYVRAAAGLLQRRGLDPFEHGAARLGEVPVLEAIAPGSRGTPSSDGPLGTFLSHLAVSIGAGSPLGAVIVLRVVAVLAVIWCGRLVAEYARLQQLRPDRALTLTVLNPLVLLYLVSAAHLDALLIAFILAAVLAARQRRWTAAVVAAALAASVTAQGFVALLVLVAAHLAARRRARWWQVLGRDLVIAAAVVVGLGLAVPGGFGWLHTVHRQFADHTPYSVPGATAVILSPIMRMAAYDDLAIGGRAAAIVALACALAYLVVTVRRRPVDQGVGYALLALALLAPSLHPWYLLWGLLCLAATAEGGRRTALLALSAAGCVLAPQGFSDAVGYAVTGGLLIAVAAGVLLAPRWPSYAPRWAARQDPPDTSRTAGRTSAR